MYSNKDKIGFKFSGYCKSHINLCTKSYPFDSVSVIQKNFAFAAHKFFCPPNHKSVPTALIDCIDLGLIRSRFYSVPDMKALFGSVNVDRILSFVKDINLFSKILGAKLLIVLLW